MQKKKTSISEKMSFSIMFTTKKTKQTIHVAVGSGKKSLLNINFKNLFGNEENGQQAKIFQLTTKICILL